MFVGHFAVALAAKKVAPKPSLGTYFFAAQFADILWPVFLLTGLEKVAVDPGNTAFTPFDFISYPYSHSLVTVVLWSVLFGFIYFKRRSDARGAKILGAVVFSHWILDFVTHRADMPLAPGLDIKVGLELWRSVPATLVIEGSMFAGALFLYYRATQAVDKIGRFGMGGLVALLSVAYLNAAFGPPPPDSVMVVASSTLIAFVLVIAWAYWADAHRKPTTS